MRFLLTLIAMSISLSCFSTQENNLIEEVKSILTKEQLLSRGIVKHDFFVINTVPKCGTHFIMTCIYFMLNKKVDEGYDYVTENMFTAERARNYFAFLNSLKSANYIHKTHVPYFPGMENTLLKAQCKWLLFIRDPRDALVSLVFYLDKFKGNQRDFMLVNSEIYDRLSFDDKVLALMTGSCCTNYLDYFYRKITGWHKSKYGLMVKFEHLIGPNGGGTKNDQLESIQKISTYLNINLSQEEIEAVAFHCFLSQPDQKTDGKTYKRSQVGSWKKYLSEKNKTTFKRLFNKELIELGYEANENW